MAKRYEILFTLDELLLKLVAERFCIPEPCAKALVVALGWPLKGIEFACFDKQLICSEYQLVSFINT